MTKQKDAGKDQRIVLNLSAIQAEQLLRLLKTEGDETARKICIRIQKTLHKHAIEEGQNEEDLKAEAEMEMGVSEAELAGNNQELPEETMKAIGQATQEVENELNEKCRACGSKDTLPEPDGTILCEVCGAVFEPEAKK